MVDRGDALSRHGPRRQTEPGPSTATHSRMLGMILSVIACLELAWLGWFLVVPLPNVQGVVMRRGLLLLKTFPEVVPGTSFQDSLMGRGLAEFSHVENLSQ